MNMTLTKSIAELERLVSSIQAYCQAAALTDSACGNICLVAEELFVNFLRHSDAPELICQIEPRTGNAVTLIFTDSGSPFDPLTRVAAPATDLCLEEREPGGLGIFLVKQLSESVEYEYAQGHNCVQVTLPCQPG